MKRFQIETTLNAADCRATNASSPAVFGIHVQIGAAAFPSTDWRDFGVVILGWWAAELQALEAGLTDVATLRFMDGPYEMRVAVDSGDRWQITTQTRGQKPSVLVEAVVKPAQMIAEVTRASASILKSFDDNDCWTDDCEKLASLVSEKSKKKGDAPHVTGN